MDSEEIFKWGDYKNFVICGGIPATDKNHRHTSLSVCKAIDRAIDDGHLASTDKGYVQIM
jgi:hypothetical protein